MGAPFIHSFAGFLPESPEKKPSILEFCELVLFLGRTVRQLRPSMLGEDTWRWASELVRYAVERFRPLYG